MVLAAILPDNFALSKLDKQDRYPMHAINHTPPERMTAEQRRREIALMLARGLARLRMAQSPRSETRGPESEIALGFCGHQSVHSDPVNNRNAES